MDKKKSRYEKLYGNPPKLETDKDGRKYIKKPDPEKKKEKTEGKGEYGDVYERHMKELSDMQDRHLAERKDMMKRHMEEMHKTNPEEGEE